MSSITEHEQKIKRQLLVHLGDLAGFLVDSIEQNRSAHEVEKGLWEQMKQLGRRSLVIFFNQCGNGDEGAVLTLDDGREVKRLPELHSRLYSTVFGEFELPRYVYGSRQGQKIEHVPLDARLQLPAQKFSYLLQDWHQAMATDLPFGKVKEHVDRILGLKTSVNSLEQSNQKLATFADSFWKQQVTPLPESRDATQANPTTEDSGQKATVKQRIIVSSGDGKGVIMRSSELEAKPGQSTKQSGRPGNRKMALIGSVYTIDAYPRSPEQVLAALFADLRVVSDEDLPTRPRPLNKQVRGALLRNEQGKTDPQSDVIFGWMAGEVRQRQGQQDNTQKAHLVLLMDGQDSLWKAGEKHLPQKQFAVTEILDLIHATQYVWTATHLFYAKGSPEAAAHARQQTGKLLNSQVNTVIAEWREKASEENISLAKQESLETVCGYFTTHAHRMMYKDYLEKGYPVASGVIEGACRNVVKDRMEHSGMRWTMKGAHAMLELRCIQLSGLWDEFMEFWRDSENKRLYSATPAANDGRLAKVAFG